MTSPVLTPFTLGPVTLRNRIVKSATNEGMAPDGLVGDRLIELHRRFAAGGVGATTLAYCSVSPEGRTYRHQIWMRPEALSGLRRLTDAVHDEGAAAIVQLGHAGWFANPKATRQPNLGPSRVFSPYAQRFSTPMTDDDFVRLTAAYRDAGAMAVETGFDAVEVHVGHGYLLSQFLSPYTNRRTDRWGGPLEHRARFPRQAVRAVRDGVGDAAAVTVKLNMDDGFDGGLETHEGVEVARMLERDGAAHALQLTGGFTARTPMYLMRGDVPISELVDNEPNTIRRLGMRLLAPRFMKAWPFEEAFFLPKARQVRRAVSMPLMLLGGITRLDTMEQAVGPEGFELVAMARALLREPDLPIRLAAGETDRSICIPCNKCLIQMEQHGTRCVYVPESEWV